MVAQKLYEGGYITYMRTDSTTYSKDLLEKLKSLLKENGEMISFQKILTSLH